MPFHTLLDSQQSLALQVEKDRGVDSFILALSAGSEIFKNKLYSLPVIVACS